MECLGSAIFTANISKAIMRDILSLSHGITCWILIVSRQKDPPTDDPVTSSLSLSISLCEGEEIFFINEIFNFYLRPGPGPFNPLRLWGNVLMAQTDNYYCGDGD